MIDIISKVHTRLLDVIERSESFQKAQVDLEKMLIGLSNSELVELLHSCGNLPEPYEASSTEEKIYGKAMDMVVGEALARMGFSVEVVTKRSNSGDVVAISPECDLVLDAKSQRFSRAALNPKDSKLPSLDIWRGSHKYSVLVGPAFVFATKKSRIYSESTRHRVLLMSFSHLGTMLEQMPVAEVLNQVFDFQFPDEPSDEASAYWNSFDVHFCQKLGLDHLRQERILFNGLQASIQAGHQAEAYFQSIPGWVHQISRSELEKLCLKLLRVDSRLKQVRKRLKELKVALKSDHHKVEGGAPQVAENAANR